MNYREFQPHILLAPYIETYWTVSGFKQEKEYHRILPDGCVDIIFSFVEPSNQHDLNSLVPNIIGTMTTYSEGSYFNEIDLLGIRFKPAGFTAFTRTPIHEFTDRRIDLTSTDSLFDKEFYCRLPEMKTVEERINHIENYLIKRIRNIFDPEPQIIYAVDLIRQTGGKLPLTEVAAAGCLSLRHFERKFKSAIGVSPKTFSKITKFRHTLSYLKRNNNAGLLSVAVDCGYYDQAHLIKDFKSLSGNLPSYFKS